MPLPTQVESRFEIIVEETRRGSKAHFPSIKVRHHYKVPVQPSVLSASALVREVLDALVSITCKARKSHGGNRFADPRFDVRPYAFEKGSRFLPIFAPVQTST